MRTWSGGEWTLGALKVKGGKKKLQKSEEIIGLADRIRIWTEANGRRIAGAVAAALVILLSAWGVRAYFDSKEASARQEYGRILEKIQGNVIAGPEKWKEILPELEGFAGRRKGAKAAQIAQIDLMQAYFETSRYEDALKTGQEALKSLSSGDRLAPFVRYQLALVYQKLGKPDEAGAQLELIKKGPYSVLGRELHWHLARLYTDRQEYAKAVEQYETALKVSASYPGDALLEAELASARTKAGSAGVEVSKQGS
jgi:predicted negative regulator of RcsB-dependent stress response